MLVIKGAYIRGRGLIFGGAYIRDFTVYCKLPHFPFECRHISSSEVNLNSYVYNTNPLHVFSYKHNDFHLRLEYAYVFL